VQQHQQATENAIADYRAAADEATLADFGENDIGPDVRKNSFALVTKPLAASLTTHPPEYCYPLDVNLLLTLPELAGRIHSVGFGRAIVRDCC
jgi:hypothetical protein